MKRFIRTFTISRVAMIIVKHDGDANMFRVLQWNADDEQPKEVQAFRYVPKEFASTDDVKFHQMQDDAIRFATKLYERERDAQRGKTRSLQSS